MENSSSKVYLEKALLIPSGYQQEIASKQTITVAILEDDQLVAQLLADFLRKENMNVVFLAFDILSMKSQMSQSLDIPDILLIDLKLKNESGIEAASYLGKHYPHIKLIALSGYYQPMHSGYLFQRGFHAFLPKEINKFLLVKVINYVIELGSYFTEEQLDVLKNQLNKKIPGPLIQSDNILTERETDVLKLVCAQHTTAEIAELLFISIKTVETHKSNLLLKTHSKNMAGLVLHAIKKGIVNPAELLAYS